MKKIAIGIAAVIIIGGIAGYFFYQSQRPHPSFATVAQGPIVQQVLATGNLESPTTIDLAFQNAGKLTLLAVRVGTRVAAGDVLARQDASVLQAQLRQAEAAVTTETARLDALRSGATPQTIAVSQAALTSAEQALANSYAGVPNTIDDAYAKANDAARNQLAPFFSLPESYNPRLTFSVNDLQVVNDIQNARATASTELNSWQRELDSVPRTASAAALDVALQNAKKHLAAIGNLTSLSLTAVTDEVGLDTATVAAYNTAATAAEAEVTTASAAVNAAEQAIAADRAAMEQAQASLALTVASSTPQDVQAQTAQVSQAEENVAAIQAQISQTVLTAPSDGVITDTNGNVGENVMPGSSVVSLMPENALEVKVNVSEDNIVGVRVGQPAQISLDAFPAGRFWNGTVVRIDPAQTIIGGAVYYKTTIVFDQSDPAMKPGMTANVLIETGYASSTLSVPASAIQRNGTSTFVQVDRGGEIVDQPVIIGLKSQDGMIELLGGVTAGEQVVTGN